MKEGRQIKSLRRIDAMSQLVDKYFILNQPDSEFTLRQHTQFCD